MLSGEVEPQQQTGLQILETAELVCKMQAALAAQDE
jgi:hypothetical protein